jgi:hypothetical protein
MAAYLSTEQDKSIELADVDLGEFVLEVAQGTWNPRTPAGGGSPGGGASPSAANLGDEDGRRSGGAKRAQLSLQFWVLGDGDHFTERDAILWGDRSGQFRLVFGTLRPVGVRDANGGSARVWRGGTA